MRHPHPIPFGFAVRSASWLAVAGLAVLLAVPAADARPRFGPRAVFGILTAPLGVIGGLAGRRLPYHYRQRALRQGHPARSRAPAVAAAAAAAGALAAQASWAGAVFWPNGFADMFGYVAKSDGAETRFWTAGFADVLAGVLAPVTTESNGMRGRAVAAAGGDDRTIGAGGGVPAISACSAPTARAAADIAARIEQTAQPIPAQQQIFATLRAALTQAGETMARACPGEPALTAPLRLAVMRERLWAMQSAAQSVRGPLAAFQTSLDDAQKARLDGPPPAATNEAAANPPARTTADSARVAQADGGVARVCHMQAQAASARTQARLRAGLRLDKDQQENLKTLTDLAAGMAKFMVASCPAVPPASAVGRLDAVLDRLDAMLYALGVVDAPLQGFYGGLSDEQKAKFDALGGREES